jgi:cytoskeletal protein CcmA (bactofilin family)
MWNKRAEETPRPAQEPQATVNTFPNTPPTRPNAALIGKNVWIKGHITSQEDLTIDGEVEGAVDVVGHRLTVGPSGKLQADAVKAREVVVAGKLTGSVDATEKVLLRKEGELVGDVQTAGIVIEDGAYFKGAIDIRRGSAKAEDAVTAAPTPATGPRNEDRGASPHRSGSSETRSSRSGSAGS